MTFGRAVEQFGQFLRVQGHSGPLQWIAPGDVAFWRGKLLVRPSGDAEGHARHIFNVAQQRGFGAAIEAIAKLDHSICCFVFAPADGEEASRVFIAPPFTMKVREDLKRAQRPGRMLWWAARSLRSTCARSRDVQFFGYDLDRRDTADVI
jgi:hypothetical protein